MSFILTIHDSKGKELNLGDIVKIITNHCMNVDFYARVTYLKKEMALAPFHTFSFHHFEKVDKLPSNAEKCTEERYDIWRVDLDGEFQESHEAEKYLMEWRHCEHLLEEKIFRIGISGGEKLKFFER